MKAGWIKLHRRLLDNPRATDPEWLSVWIYLLLNATHQPQKMNFDGKIVELQPGQLITGRFAIAKATGVSDAKVYRVLETLKNEQQIEQLAGVKGSMFTVSNWREYQETEQQTEQRLNSNRTATEQRLNTNKNVRTEECKNEKKRHTTESESFKAFYSAYPRKVSKQPALKAFTKLVEPNAAELLPVILAALKWQTTSPEWQRDNGRYVPHPATYLNEHRWDDQPATNMEASHANGF